MSRVMAHRQAGRSTLEESMMVLRRWAMVMMVEPLKFCRMALWMKASVSPSTLAVASSSTSTLGLHAAPRPDYSWHQEHARLRKGVTRIS